MRNTYCKQIWIMAFVVLVLLTLAPSAFAQSVEIFAEGVYQMGDNDTPSAAEDRALLKAKRNAVEQAGTYIASYTNVKNLQVTDDNLIALSAGAIKVNVLDTKRTQIGNGMEIRVKIKALVDTERLDEFIKNLGAVQKSTTVTTHGSQPAPTSVDMGIIKFNGLYQAVSYHGQGHYYYYYYRFFPNGTVSSYSSPFNDLVSDVYKSLELAPSGSGNYFVQNGEMTFSLIYPKGNIDYKGTMVDDNLRLVFHSYIINTDGGYDCKFIEVN
jgi:hypothetical protein